MRILWLLLGLVFSFLALYTESYQALTLVPNIRLKYSRQLSAIRSNGNSLDDSSQVLLQAADEEQPLVLHCSPITANKIEAFDDSSNNCPVSPTQQNSELLAILIVYFVQGALGLSRLATNFYMKDELHLSPADMASINGITMLPWVVKPLYGFLSDNVPLYGYRRRSYLILSGILGCLSWLSLGMNTSKSIPAVVSAIFIGSAAVALSDVVVDSIVVERSRIDETIHDNVVSKAGDLQSLCWSAAAAGGILSAYSSGSLLEEFSPQVIFYITAIFPLLVSIAAFFIPETYVNSNDENMKSDKKPALSVFKSQFGEIWKTLRNPSIYLPVLFVFFWQSTPDSGAAMFYFNTNELHFTPGFLGQVRLASSIASLVGVIIFRNILQDKSIKDIIFWTTILSVPLGLSQVLLTTHINRDWNIPDELFMLTDSVVLAALGQVAFMPTLVLASKLCPPGSEGTLFATLMSIYNLSHTVAAELGSWLTSALGVVNGNYDNLTLLVAICASSGIIPLFFLFLLDSDVDSEKP